MNNKKTNLKITSIVNNLCSDKDYFEIFNENPHGIPNPSINNIKEIAELFKRIIFPGYFGDSSLVKDTMNYYVGVNLDKFTMLLSEEIKRGFCFECKKDKSYDSKKCNLKSEKTVETLIHDRIPAIRKMLISDVIATYNGDPASKSFGEIIFCYPGIKALINYRLANELYKLDVPIIPRIITEMAHSDTGIDIHPGANIDESFAIDHGTGVVIGETCIIGKNVKIYQGVTLGAKNFPMDSDGNPIKGVPRHPMVEDNVIIYAQATILGRITIGKNSVIGGNVWITEDVPENSKILQNLHRENNE